MRGLPPASQRSILASSVNCRLTLVVAAGLALSGIGCTPPAQDSPAGTSPDAKQIPSGFSLPSVTTPADQLTPDGYQHVEVFRIRRDFGKRNFEIALDAWTPTDKLTQVDEVRLWWFKTTKGGERGPFSKKSKRHFDISYERRDEGQWVVQLIAGSDRRFTFLVEADGKGGVFAYGTVKAEGGQLVERCRVTSGELRAKTTLGLTTGIKDLRVTCTDAEGGQHEGTLAS